MSVHIKARRLALTTAAALTAALAAAVPAASAQAATVSPQACSAVAALDRDEHTGNVFAVAYASCPIQFVATMRSNLWIDNTNVKGASQACPLGTTCYTSSGSVPPRSGRHRYCAQAVFFFASPNPSQTAWSCRYMG